MGFAKSRRRVAASIAGVVLVSLATVDAARVSLGQGFRGFGGRGTLQQLPNAPYDGRFTFVRVNYETTADGFWYGGWPAWAHGYPVAERNLMKIMNEVSLLGAHDEEINTFTFDDPGLCRYPVAYVIEVDWWVMSDSEASALRAYMEKGGFVIVDDFKVRRLGGGFSSSGSGGGGWPTFEAAMRRVVPEGRFIDMDAAHPIFHSFFEISSLDNFPQAYIPGKPIFRGLFEDNDPTKRLMMIVNYNTDISQYWEWSGRGFRPFDETNEAYKLGVNYLVYGLTH